jgi:large subunit ribosomal protein L35
MGAARQAKWHACLLKRPAAGSIHSRGQNTETEMPKMKTKSGAKKRFKLTASGKVKAGQAGKQHGMIKRTNKQIRNNRGTTVLKDCNARVIKKKFLPNG